MTTLKKYDLTGQEVGAYELDDQFLDVNVNPQMIKDYVVALRENRRQWSACTRERGEVNHSNKKPRPQKGTGNARQGRLSSPQFKGGGVVFGPKPKFDQHVRINRKERRKILRYLIAQKIKENHLIVLTDDALEVPKTKVVANFLKTLGLEKRVLFLGESNAVPVDAEDGQTVDVRCTKHDHLKKSLRNLSKVSFNLARCVNGYDLVTSQDLVVTEQGVEELKQWLA